MKTIKIAGLTATLLLAFAAVAGYGATQTRQIGADGVAMQVTESEERLAERAEANQVPRALSAPTGGALAAEAYENVQVLGHLTTGEFTTLMAAMTSWVAPETGCAYCHNSQNLASDELYTKVVARRMIQMTMYINEHWQQHVHETGVTCYTCHRGNPVPEYHWFSPVPDRQRGAVGTTAWQNAPITTRTGLVSLGLSSLPRNALQTYLYEDRSIRVQSGRPLPSGNRSSVKQAEWTYALMVHFSNSLGVNCTYCHNSRSWADWSQSPLTRTTAWYGIRMVRGLNHDYLDSLSDVFPRQRLGPNGDVARVNCMTCHQGAYRPLLGVSMLQDYPALARAVAQPEIDDEPSDDALAPAPEPSPLPGELEEAQGAESTVNDADESGDTADSEAGEATSSSPEEGSPAAQAGGEAAAEDPPEPELNE